VSLLRSKAEWTYAGLYRGNPLRVILTAGQQHDTTQAQALFDGLTFEKVMPDRGYAGAFFIVNRT